jgi:uncharacterized protein (TIGR02147 family)
MQEYLEHMRGLVRSVDRVVVPIDSYEYYAKWYHVVIREAACILDWQDDYTRLARSIHPRVSKREARESVAFLLAKGFLERTTDGRYRQKHPALTSGAEVTALGVRAFNKLMAQRAADAIEEFAPSERDIRSLVVGVSADGYRLIKQEIQEFIRRVVRIVDDDRSPQRVYTLSVQLFPSSAILKTGDIPDDDAEQANT